MGLFKQLVWTIGVPCVASVSVLGQSVDDQLDQWFADQPVNAKLWAEEGSRIYAEGARHGDCLKLQEGYALLLAAFGHDPEVQVPVWSEGGCALEGHYMAFFEGNRAFDEGDYSRALEWFGLALGTARTSKQRAKVKSNTGMCYYWDNDLEQALEWLVAATEEGLENMSANALNNIAGICLSLHHFEQALNYSGLAEERLLVDFKEGMELGSFVRYHDLILLSRMAAHFELDQFEEARTAYERANLEGFFPGLAPEFVHMAFMLAWQLNEPVLLDMHADAFGAALMEDSVGAVERFGPVLGMLPPWSDALDSAEVPVWASLRAMRMDQLPLLPEVDSLEQAESAVPMYVMWLGGAIWFISGLMAHIWMQWRHRAKHKSMKQAVADVLVLREVVEEGVPQEVRDRAMQVLEQFESRWTDEVLQVDFEALTRRELDALRAALAGERPKETAQRLNLSLRAVYAMRASLRGKLGIEKEMDLDAWLNQHWTA